MSRPVIALAGRRIDAPDAHSSAFAIDSVAIVAARLRDLLKELDPTALVASAACGADLLALQIAGELGIRRRVVLPFDAARFRASSVTDRPDARWGPLYDEVLAEVRASNDLVTLSVAGDANAAYAAANEAILDQAQAVAGADGNLIAAVVWEGERPPRDGDVTRDFATAAVRRGFELRVVSTRPQAQSVGDY
jgi:hypothetical protein